MARRCDVSTRRLFEHSQRSPHGIGVARSTNRAHTLDLTLLERAVVRCWNGWRLLAVAETIHAYDHALTTLHAHLLIVRAARDLLLHEAGRDRLFRAAERVDTTEQLHRASLERVGQLFHVVAARQGICRGCDAALVTEHLLRTERQRRRLGGGKRERFVVAIRMQRLGAAEYRRQRLYRHTHDVVEGLLCRKRDAAGLRVKTQPGAGIAGLESL